MLRWYIFSGINSVISMLLARHGGSCRRAKETGLSGKDRGRENRQKIATFLFSGERFLSFVSDSADYRDSCM